MRSLVALLAAVSLTACDTGGPDGPSVGDLTQDPALLVGTWEWARSVTYAEPTGTRGVLTPATAGRTESVAFGADGAFAEYVDGDLVREGPYGPVWLGAFGVDEDDLVLTTAPADGPTKYYRRAD